MGENGLAESTVTSGRRTRRQLLYGGAAAALGVVAAEALGRTMPAAAANGGPILMGQGNQSTANTFVNDSGGDTTFEALATVGGTALEGDAVNGIGVNGTSGTGIGVSGSTGSTAANASAVFGEVTSAAPGAYSAGVRGQNDGTGGDGIGVYGSQAGSGWGVYGTAVGGIGVNGSSSTGIGVQGSGTSGVVGLSDSLHGAGVLAQNPFGGPALRVDGVAAFSRSGVVTVPAGKSLVTHRLPLSAASFVLATIQGNVAGLYVRGVTTAAGSNGSFTIHLSTAARSKTKVAWLAIN